MTAVGAFALACMMACSAQAYYPAVQEYLLETSTPGYTMERQGPEVAIGRLHPDFATRLAETIAEARAEGMSEAGIFSAYRPPAFGVGGFSDKFDSLHSYGLAVDMTGIGRAGSDTARRFHKIAAEHGIACVYGPLNRSEWNHCQASWLLRIAPGTLRSSITLNGPIDLEAMWHAAEKILAWIGPTPAAAAAELPPSVKKKRHAKDGKHAKGHDKRVKQVGKRGKIVKQTKRHRAASRES